MGACRRCCRRRRLPRCEATLMCQPVLHVFETKQTSSAHVSTDKGAARSCLRIRSCRLFHLCCCCCCCTAAPRLLLLPPSCCRVPSPPLLVRLPRCCLRLIKGRGWWRQQRCSLPSCLAGSSRQAAAAAVARRTAPQAQAAHIPADRGRQALRPFWRLHGRAEQ